MSADEKIAPCEVASPFPPAVEGFQVLLLAGAAGQSAVGILSALDPPTYRCGVCGRRSATAHRVCPSCGAPGFSQASPDPGGVSIPKEAGS